MGFFNKLRDMKDSVSYKLDDVKYFVVDRGKMRKTLSVIRYSMQNILLLIKQVM
ncbi:UNVERIFIED_ORG: hypothetical protein ABIC97_000727 [Peribacillus simplex]